MRKFRLAILMCLWKRPSIAKVALDTINAQLRKSRFECQVFCIGSEGNRSRKVAEEAGAAYTEFPNEPLGRKFNYGLASIRESWEADGVMVLGSDNAVTSGFISNSVKLMRSGADVTGCLDGVIINAETKQAVLWPGYQQGNRVGEPLGSGRCYGRKLLDSIHWELWENLLNRGLDHSATQRCIVADSWWGTFKLKVPKMVHIGLKSSTNIGKWESIAENGTKVSASDILESSFGRKARDAVWNLGKQPTPDHSIARRR